MSQRRVLALIPGHEEGQEFIFARRQMSQMTKYGIVVKPYYLNSRTRISELIKHATRFHRLIKEFEPHVIHAHYGTMTGFFAVAIANKPVVISYKGTDLNPSSEHSWVRGAFSRLLSQISAPFATEIICVSEELRNRLWWRKKSVKIVIDGIDLNEFFPIDRRQARKTLGWSLNNRIILFNNGAGQPPNKRRDLVDKSVALLERKLSAVELVVMKGETPSNMVPYYINAADVVLMTSDFEGSPNIVKEALACNVPVCSVAVGDVPQQLEGVDNCLLVSRDPSQISDALLKLIDKPLRSNGRDFSHRYSALIHTEKVCKILKYAADQAISR